MEKTYFVSDLHLGAPALTNNRDRERRFVQWLDFVQGDAKAIYLVGDIFDFWYEYKKVVPKGFVRSFGKLAELSDKGVEIYFFKGNHDLWTFGYLKEEMDIKVYSKPVQTKIGNKTFFVGHGDGLDPNEKGYLFLKKIFENRFLQWCFSRLHPNFALWLGHTWSKKSRIGKMDKHDVFAYKGEDKEASVVFAKNHRKINEVDYYIFGHRHLMIDVEIENARVIQLGDWINYYSYGVFDGEKFELKIYE